METTFTYNKTEKLKSKKTIDELFAKGKSFVVFPVKIFYQFVEKDEESNINCGVAVSKKSFSKAVDRNRIKRLLRETYRLNKLPLHNTVTEKKLVLFIVFIDKKIPVNQQHLNKPITEAIEKICAKYLAIFPNSTSL